MIAFALGASASLIVLWGWVLRPLWHGHWRASAVALGVALPTAAAALYVHLGQPQVFLEASRGGDVAPALAAVGPEQIQAMVERLTARLQAQPEDVAGWRMLARSNEQLGRWDQAVLAYRQLQRLTPQDPDMLTDFAVTLGLSLDAHSLQGEPERLILQALAVNPDHLQALALAGSVAYERHDHALAAQRWRRVQAAVPADSPLARSIAQSIERVESQSAP